MQNVQLNTLNSLNRSPTPKSMKNESLNISRSFEDLDKYDKITIDKSHDNSLFNENEKSPSICNNKGSMNSNMNTNNKDNNIYLGKMNSGLRVAVSPDITNKYNNNNSMSNNISSLVKPIMSIPSTENRFELINNKSN